MGSSRGGEEGEGGLPPPFPGMTRRVQMEEDPFSTYPSMEEYFVSQRLGSVSTSLYPPLEPWLKEVNEPEQRYSIFTFRPLPVFNGGEAEEEDNEEEDKGEEEEAGLDAAYVAEEEEEEYDVDLAYKERAVDIGEEYYNDFVNQITGKGDGEEKDLYSTHEQCYSIFTLTTEQIFYRLEPLPVFNEGGEAEEDDYEEEDKGEEEEAGLDAAYVAEEEEEEYDVDLAYKERAVDIGEEYYNDFVNQITGKGDGEEKDLYSTHEQCYSIFTLTTEQIFYRLEPLPVFNEGGEAEEDDYEEEDKGEEEEAGLDAAKEEDNEEEGKGEEEEEARLDSAYVAAEVDTEERVEEGEDIVHEGGGGDIVHEGEFIEEDRYVEDCGCLGFRGHKYKSGDDIICSFMQPYK